MNERLSSEVVTMWCQSQNRFTSLRFITDLTFITLYYKLTCTKKTQVNCLKLCVRKTCKCFLWNGETKKNTARRQYNVGRITYIVLAQT